MVAVSRLGRQISEITNILKAIGAEWALIGGLALAAYKVVRATQDVDLLVDLDRAEDVDSAMVKIGYRCLHRSTDAGNYQRGDERVDFLYASRPIARRLLNSALELETSLGALRIVSAEGLIQVPLLLAGSAVQEQQSLYAARQCKDPYDELDHLMAVVEALCPVWPPRNPFTGGNRMLL